MITTIRSTRGGNPCQGCPDRYTACADHCRKPEYLAYREEQARIRKARQAYQNGIWSNEEPYQKRDPLKRTKK